MNNKISSAIPLTENVLCSGDHVSWHTPLDGSESRIQHMLMTEDSQLQPTSSVLGAVNFIQVSTRRYDLDKKYLSVNFICFS